MTISQSREEGKGLLFLSRQNGLLSPPETVETTKQSWCFLFFRNKLILKLIYNTQSKWQVGIDDRLFSSAHYCFPGGFASSVFFVGRYWWNTHTHNTQQRVDDFYSSFIFVGGSFISSSSSSSSSSLKQCLFVSVALFNKRAYSKLKMICNNYNQFFFCVCIYVKLIILLSLFSLLQMKWMKNRHPSCWRW